MSSIIGDIAAPSDITNPADIAKIISILFATPVTATYPSQLALNGVRELEQPFGKL